jgi:hypothetical protein
MPRAWQSNCVGIGQKVVEEIKLLLALAIFSLTFIGSQKGKELVAGS